MGALQRQTHHDRHNTSTFGSFGSRDGVISNWFIGKRWSLGRKNESKAKWTLQEVPPTKTICTKHRTSSKPCVKQESTDGWKCRMYLPCALIEILGLLSEFKRKHTYAEQVNSNSIFCVEYIMFLLIIGEIDPPCRLGFWFLSWSWYSSTSFKIIPNSAMVQDTNPHKSIQYENIIIYRHYMKL